MINFNFTALLIFLGIFVITEILLVASFMWLFARIRKVSKTQNSMALSLMSIGFLFLALAGLFTTLFYVLSFVLSGDARSKIMGQIAILSFCSLNLSAIIFFIKGANKLGTGGTNA